MTAIDSDTLVRDFVDTFNAQDADALAPFFTEDIVFAAYGDAPVKGRDAVVALWKGVFANFGQVKFETVHQAVNGDVVIAEQVHGLALPGGKLAPIMNMAVYELRDGKIAAWRDYTNPAYASKLLQG
ncbi:nuclear transport factor 2 family protein [Streptomyces sp. NPDC001315]|uniref:nuclear transport factor 2 family protein n=1 Tax=Streptomyces sp. NPDC001315 TaxID=3364562 RepID=UPI00367763AB